jgi:enoyl-CoA hydratase
MNANVQVARDGAVLVLTINRPERRNAIDRATSEALAAALDLLDADDGLSVGILTGAGAHFCAGMDLKAFLAGERVELEGRGLGGLVMRPPHKPLMAVDEAERWGLINRRAAEGQALAAAKALAAEVAQNAPLSLAATKKVVSEAARWPEAEVWARQNAILEDVITSEDAREGARAFAEKRPPVWRGR